MSLRLAEVLIGLSGVSDLGMGRPVGEAARTCLVAHRLAQRAAPGDDMVATVYYTALLMHAGCTAYSYELSKLMADEQSVKRAALSTNFADPRDVVVGFLGTITREAPAGAKLRTLANGALRSRQITAGYSSSNCQVGSLVASRVGLPTAVSDSLLDVFEWWNGKGGPRGLRGEQIAWPTRVAHVAQYVALFAAGGGVDDATDAVRSRAGGYLDPELCTTALPVMGELVADLDDVDVLAELADEEPRPHATVPEWRVDDVLAAFGDAVDLKAPMFHGHSAAVRRFAEGAAERLGLARAEVTIARRAGAAGDLGRAAIPTAVWMRPAFTSSDWGQARLHPYYSEQVLERSPVLAAVAPVAGAHHERLDGSGYYRRATGSTLPAAARVVAAADALATRLEPRPHRAAFSLDRAASELGRLAPAQLDPAAVDAVLAAADAPAPSAQRSLPAGLTERQLEVLCLVAEGRSNREIGELLGISPRTAEHHVQDVYAKVGVVGRAPAALFAMEHGLLGAAVGQPRPL